MSNYLDIIRLNVYSEPDFKLEFGDDYLGFGEDSLNDFFKVHLPTEAGLDLYLASEGHGNIPVVLRLDDQSYVISIDDRVYFLDRQGVTTASIRLDYLIYELHLINNVVIVYAEVEVAALSPSDCSIIWEEFAPDIIEDFSLNEQHIRYRTWEGETFTICTSTGVRV